MQAKFTPDGKKLCYLMVKAVPRLEPTVIPVNFGLRTSLPGILSLWRPASSPLVTAFQSTASKPFWTLWTLRGSRACGSHSLKGARRPARFPA
jgi:hypothetical protein